MTPTNLEVSTLEWLASVLDDDLLSTQVSEFTVAKRDYTGVGCYSDVSPTNAVTAPSLVKLSSPVTGPYIQHSTLQYGAMTLIWFTNGIIDLIEFVAYGDYFPRDHMDLEDCRLTADIP